jgi:type VI secretion system protein ImpH
VGIGTTGVQERSASAADTVAFYAGLLSMRTRPAHGMAQLMATTSASGTRRAVRRGMAAAARRRQVCLDADGDDGRLGSAVIGSAVFDVGACPLHLGLSREQFDGFLPGGRAHEMLRSLARLYADDQLAWKRS